MSDDNGKCPTCGQFRGFRPGDLSYNPDFDTPVRTKELDPANLDPDPAILAEYKEFFGEDGFLQRSMYVDALGGGPVQLRTEDRPVDQTRVSLATAAQRYMRGVKLPSAKETLGLIRTTYGDEG